MTVMLPCGHVQDDLHFDWRLAKLENAGEVFLMIQMTNFVCLKCHQAYLFQVHKDAHVPQVAISDDRTELMIAIEVSDAKEKVH